MRGAHPSFEITGLSPGLYEVQHDFSLDAPRTFFLSVVGGLFDEGVPFEGAVDLIVRSYVFDPEMWDVFPPYVPWTQSVSDVEIVDGVIPLMYFDLPEGTNLVSLEVRFDGQAGGWQRSFLLGPDTVVSELPLMHQTPLVLDRGGPRLRIRGEARFGNGEPGCPAGPFLFHQQVWAFETPPPEGLPWPPGDWPGAVPLGRYLVVPDPFTREFDLSIALPPGTARVVVERSRDADLYPNQPIRGGQSFGINTNPVSGADIGFDKWIGCP
jgi:hypothetical protein